MKKINFILSILSVLIITSCIGFETLSPDELPAEPTHDTAPINIQCESSAWSVTSRAYYAGTDMLDHFAVVVYDNGGNATHYASSDLPKIKSITLPFGHYTVRAYAYRRNGITTQGMDGKLDISLAFGDVTELKIGRSYQPSYLRGSEPTPVFFGESNVTINSKEATTLVIDMSRYSTGLSLQLQDDISSVERKVYINLTQYCALNLKTGEGEEPAETQHKMLMTESYDGTYKGDMQMFCPKDGYNTDIALSIRDNDNNVIVSDTIRNVAFHPNRKTTIKGRLAKSEGSATIRFNASWDDGDIIDL